MRTNILTSMLLLVALAAGCARARAATADTSAAPAAALRVAGNCPADAGPMRPAPAGTMKDLNGDGYVCARHVRSIAGDTLRITVDNDATSAAGAPVEMNLYRRM